MGPCLRIEYILMRFVLERLYRDLNVLSAEPRLTEAELDPDK